MFLNTKMARNLSGGLNRLTLQSKKKILRVRLSREFIIFKFQNIIVILSFSLYDAMTAIEMMHPQMDIGLKRIKTREIHQALKAAKLGLIPFENCHPSDLISIFDTQMGAIASWAR